MLLGILTCFSKSSVVLSSLEENPAITSASLVELRLRHTHRLPPRDRESGVSLVRCQGWRKVRPNAGGRRISSRPRWGTADFRHYLNCHDDAKCPVLDSFSVQETKSGRLSRLPPPPEAPSRKGKRNSDVSRSLSRECSTSRLGLAVNGLQAQHTSKDVLGCFSFIPPVDILCYAPCRL